MLNDDRLTKDDIACFIVLVIATLMLLFLMP
jgi:hypothetical protein